jgi:hypothetical protein
MVCQLSAFYGSIYYIGVRLLLQDEEFSNTRHCFSWTVDNDVLCFSSDSVSYQPDIFYIASPYIALFFKYDATAEPAR